MPNNSAAWLISAKSTPFVIKPAPLASPGPNQILIRSHALAINPIDVKLQTLAFYPLAYPTILGQDVSGTVLSVHPSVSRFKPGQRVLGFANGFASGKDEEKGFQEYAVLNIDVCCEIPDDMAFEKAVVLPLGVATAAAGLFDPEVLNLDLPTSPTRPKNGKTVLVWGGAGSVGGNAIQLAVAAGYEVVATCSPKNFSYVQSLGASQCFDYSSPSVVADLVIAFESKILAGVYDAIGGAAWAPCIQFTQQIKTGTKVIATVTPGFPDEHEGVEIQKVFAPSILKNGVAKAVFEDFLPKALKEGVYKAAPESWVVGTGLESVQAGIDALRKGASAKKVVVLLD